MVDVAELAIRVSSQEADKGAENLNDLAQSADRAETAVEGLGQATKRADAHTQNMNRAMQAADRHTKAMSQAGLNMGRQFTDVFVQLGSGSSAWLVALQQGPQIMDSFQVAAMQMGTTVRGAMVAMGAAIWTALAPLLPLIAAVAAAAAVGFGSFALATRAAGKEIGNLTEGMNLSEAQLKKLKEENVSTTITMGDMWNAAGTTIKEGFFDLFGDQVAVIGRKWNEFLDAAWKAVVATTKNITGGFLGAFYVIRDTWRMIPAALGDAAISAANAVLGGIERMINLGIGLINKLISAANRAADAIPGLEAFIPQLSEVEVARISNQYEGAMREMGAAAGAAWARGMGQASDFIDRQVDRLVSNAQATGQARIRKALGDTAEATRETGRAAASAAEDFRDLVEEMERMPRIQLDDIVIDVPKAFDPLLLALSDAGREFEALNFIAQDTARGLSDAFGESGRAVGELMSVLTAYRTSQGQIADDMMNGQISAARGATLLRNAQISAYADMAGAAKGFFDEQSAGYQALAAIEKVYRAYQLAASIASIAQGWTETSQSIAQATAKTGADTAAGGAKMFSQLGVWAFPMVAAMVGVLAALGAKGGSVSIPSLPSTNTGTGTVLGDSGAQSQSITRSAEMSERFWNRSLQINNAMLDSLRAIESSIDVVANNIARQMGVGGGLDTSGLNLGTTTQKGFLGLSSTIRSADLKDLGISLQADQLSDILADGFEGLFYQTIENTKQKSGFLGIGAKTVTWLTETTTAMDRALSRDLALLLQSMRDGVLTAAGQIGIEGAQSVLDAFTVNIGRISFEGMSADEISERLTAVFSAVGDQMANAVAPGIERFQKAGEGLMETLVRLATTVTTVDTALASIGMSFGQVGAASLEAKVQLVELFGGLDAFTKATSFFAEEFLTEAQRIAPVQAAVIKELERLGLSTDITRDQFAALVMGLDLSTASGQAMFAALMKLAPALDQVLDYQEKLEGVTSNAAELAKQRRELEIRLMEAQGDAAGALAARRRDELAVLDPSLRVLQELVWQTEDARKAQEELARAQEEAAAKARAIAEKRTSLEIELLEAQGRSSEALALRRAMELQAIDDSLHPLQKLVWATQDAAVEAERLAQAQREAAEAAAALARTRADLEIRLMEATGDAAGALAARRRLEMEALDDSLRPLLASIFAAEDAAKAQQELADAQAEAADRARQLAEQQRGLELRLLDAQGRSVEALALRRQQEIEATDESLRAMLLAIYAAEDLAKANQEVAQAAQAAAQAAEQEAQRLAQLAQTRRTLEIALMEALGQSVEAVAAQRQMELEALDPTLRALKEQVWAANDARASSEALAQALAEQAAQAEAVAKQRRDLEIELLEATGQTTAALEARRALELATLDESLRGLRLQIWAANDATEANEALAQAQRDAAEANRQLAVSRAELELRLLEAQGRSAEALAISRARELAAMDESLRPLLSLIWATEDLSKANEEAAQAAEEAAQQARELADTRRGLEIRLMQAMGRETEALAMQREDELAAMDASLRGLLSQIYAAEDAARANEALAVSHQRAADIARQRQQMEIQLLDLQGRTSEAMALRRAEEIAGLDESLRALQAAIYAQEDANAAAASAARAAEEAQRSWDAARDAAQQRIDDARSDLSSAYEREASALQQTIDKFASFSASLRDFRRELTDMGAGSSYASLSAEFERIAALARLGSEEGLSGLQDAGSRYLEAARNNASSALEYQMAVSRVAGAVDAAIGTSDRQKTLAEQQLDALQDQVRGLIDLNESVLSVRDAILRLEAAVSGGVGYGIPRFATGGVFMSPTMFQMGEMAEAGPEAILPLTMTSQGLGVHAVGAANDDMAAELRAVRAELAEIKAATVQNTVNTGQTRRELARWTQDGLYVRGEEPGSPVEVETAA